MSNVFSGSSIENAVRLLDIFNEANKIRATKVDFKEFYNDAINREVNLKDHFMSWI
jgi:hypothetical protein